MQAGSPDGCIPNGTGVNIIHLVNIQKTVGNRHATKMGKSVNQLWPNGHVQVRELFVYQREFKKTLEGMDDKKFFATRIRVMSRD